MTWGASLSWLWGNTAHSDLQLQLCTTQPAASADEEAANSSRSCEAVDSQGTAKVARTTGRNATAPESARAAQTSGTSYARTFRLHANILGSCSSYFQKRTTPQGDSSAALQYADAPAGAEQGCGGDGAQPRLLLLVEHVEDGEVDAAEAVLRHCYTAQLCAEGGDAAQLSVASLLQMMVLADRFDVSPCLSHCGEELAKRGAAAYDVATLNTVFNGLPPAFQGLPYHAAAVSSATERLLQLLGNAEAVGDGWTDPDSTLGQHLLQLCHPAMLALVGSSGLKTRSENSVLMMADAWVSSSSAGAACSEAQLRQLVDVISMGHLTHTFQFDLLPKLAWVKLASDEERSLARFAAADADRRASLVEHGGLAGPDAWYVRARDP